MPHKNVAKLFPESKTELWNYDAGISGSFIGMLWLFLINLFSAGCGTTSKSPAIAVSQSFEERVLCVEILKISSCGLEKNGGETGLFN